MREYTFEGFDRVDGRAVPRPAVTLDLTDRLQVILDRVTASYAKAFPGIGPLVTRLGFDADRDGGTARSIA